MVACAVKVEIAFDSGFSTPAVDRTWTDVSTRAYGAVTVGWGRADQFSSCEPLTCSLTLDNTDGALTPGNAASAYYPNVKLDRPIRVTVTPEGGSDSVRFTGYVDAWPTVWPFGTDRGSVYVNISATSRTGRLALRNALYADLTQNAIAAGATSVFPLDDPDGSTVGTSVVGTQVLKLAGSGTPGKFSGGAVQLRGGQYLTSYAPLPTEFTIALSFLSNSRGGVDLLPAETYSATELVAANDGTWHRLVLTVDTGVYVIYLDGVEVAVSVTSIDTTMRIGRPSATRTPSAWVRDVAYFPTALTSGDVTADYSAFNGGYGEMTDDRLVRYAGFAGIPSTEVDADAGAVEMGATDITGMALVDAFRVVESTEGGVLTDARDGSLRLFGRGARYNTSPTVTLSMAAEEVGADYSPTLDRFALRNEVTGTNAATSLGAIAVGESVSVTARDQGSIDEYGTAGAAVEVNAVDSSEAYGAASWIVSSHAEPQERVPALTVDLLPLNLAQTAAALGVFVGSRVEITGRPEQDATSSVELFAEGGTETFTADGASLTWSVSPIALNDSVLFFDGVGHEFDAGYYFGR